MMPSQPALQVPTAPRGEADADTLDALVRSSRRMGRFWPPLASRPEPAAASPTGVSVPSRTQLLVAGMAEYGS